MGDRIPVGEIILICWSLSFLWIIGQAVYLYLMDTGANDRK